MLFLPDLFEGFDLADMTMTPAERALERCPDGG
jgi:hypothetical protein